MSAFSLVICIHIYNVFMYLNMYELMSFHWIINMAAHVVPIKQRFLCNFQFAIGEMDENIFGRDRKTRLLCILHIFIY